MTVALQINFRAPPPSAVAELGGVMDEYADFSALLAPGTREIQIDMAAIKRCNSMGILRWSRFLQTAPREVRLVLVTVPSLIVHHMNIFPGFLAHPNIIVESFQVAYVCDPCDTRAAVTLRTTDVLGADGRAAAPAKTCAKCREAMELDAIPEKHFLFLSRPKAV